AGGARSSSRCDRTRGERRRGERRGADGAGEDRGRGRLPAPPPRDDGNGEDRLRSPPPRRRPHAEALALPTGRVLVLVVRTERRPRRGFPSRRGRLWPGRVATEGAGRGAFGAGAFRSYGGFLHRLTHRTTSGSDQSILQNPKKASVNPRCAAGATPGAPNRR